MRALTVGNMYPPHHLGGYELVWRGAVDHLRARGHEVSVITSDHRQPGVEAPDEPHVHRDLLWWWHDHRFPRRGVRERLRRERANAAVLARRVEEDRPDIVLWSAMGGMHLSLIERVRRLGTPAVGIVHDDWLVYGPQADQWLRLWAGPRGGVGERLTGEPVRVDLSGAARWLFVSDFLRRKALERGGHRLARTGVLHSGIEEAHLRPLTPAHDWEWRLLSIGRIDRRKGLGTALEALALLPRARLRVAGAGEERVLTELRAQAAALGVAERVTWMGRVQGEALADLYDRADALVFPVTWDEPWGLVPLEAMGHGLPVVATGRGGSAEYLRDGENALLHPAGDAPALAAAVERLAADAALREGLREAGRATAARHTARTFDEGVEAALLADLDSNG